MRRRDFGSVIVGALAGLVGWRPKRSEEEKGDLESTIKWIDVNERLPTTKRVPAWAGTTALQSTRLRSRAVLVTWNSGMEKWVREARWTEWLGEMRWQSPDGHCFVCEKVTHWVELPKPPKK